MIKTLRYRPTRALIHLEALKFNLNQARVYAPNAKILAVIKANAYGHGMIRVARQLSLADGFGVASIDEALLLRQNGFLQRILLMEGVFSASELALVQQYCLDFVIHCDAQLDWLLQENPNTRLNIWLKFDTGMHRLGFDPSQWKAVHSKLKQLRHYPNCHYMSHFATADEVGSQFIQQQLACFNSLTEAVDAPKCMANSAAIQTLPNSHFQWVRPGIMLYGAGQGSPSQFTQLKPVMTLQSEITSLKWIKAGETVGYGQTWQARKETFIAVVAIGYGDGYPRHASSGTPVLIHQQKVPLVGRVSMDMITVDVTCLQHQVNLGDKVILWGEGLSVDEVARHADTIGYELLCGITPRVEKIEM